MPRTRCYYDGVKHNDHSSNLINHNHRSLKVDSEKFVYICDTNNYRTCKKKTWKHVWKFKQNSFPRRCIDWTRTHIECNKKYFIYFQSLSHAGMLKIFTYFRFRTVTRLFSFNNKTKVPTENVLNIDENNMIFHWKILIMRKF